MKSIKIYNSDTEYQSAISTLPPIHVAKVKSVNNDVINFGGMKKVVDYITEEDYGTHIFDVFRAQGWIASDAHVMTMQEAKAIKQLGTAFYNDTEITDATFLRYFTGLTILSAYYSGGWKDFCGANNVVKAVIPINVTGAYDLFRGNTALQYIEVLEGVTSISQLATGGNSTTGITFKLPSTLTEITGTSFQRCGMETVDLRNTSLDTIASNFCYYANSTKEVYFPATLTSLGSTIFKQISSGKYIEFNSNTELTIGNDCFGRDTAASASVVVNFKNNIPVTVGNNFAYGLGNASNKSYVIFHSTTVPTIGTGFFNNSKASTEIYVPEGCISDYEAVANLSNFVGRIYEIGSTEWTNAGLDQYE